MLNNIVWVVYAPSPICTKSQLKLEGFENAVRVTLVILETGGALGKRFNTMFSKMYSKMFNKRAGVGPSMRAEQQQTAPWIIRYILIPVFVLVGAINQGKTWEQKRYNNLFGTHAARNMARVHRNLGSIRFWVHHTLLKRVNAVCAGGAVFSPQHIIYCGTLC